VATNGKPPAWALRLRAEREARGWNKHEMGRRLLRAEDTQWPPLKSIVRQVAWWEQGKHFPRDWANAYAEAFGMSRAALFGGHDPYRDANTARSVGSVGDEWDEDMYRRAALQLLTALSAGAAVPAEALETVLAGMDRSLGERAGLGLPDWEETAWEYGRALGTAPAARLLAGLAADVVGLRQAIERAGSERLRTGLQRVGAQLSAGLAMTLHDLGDFRASRRSWQTARRAADASGDRDLRVYVRAREAHNARSGNRPGAVVVTLTDEAVGLAGGSPSAGLAQAFANRAYLSADQGDATGARAALRNLAEVFEGLPAGPATDPASHVWSWSEARHRHAEAATYAAIGDTSNAGPVIDRTVSLLPPERRAARAQIELWRAVCLVRTGQVGDGLGHALVVLDELPAAHRATAVMRQAGRVLHALPDDAARALPAARELRALTAASAT
jgi:hypothetical protein